MSSQIAVVRGHQVLSYFPEIIREFVPEKEDKVVEIHKIERDSVIGDAYFAMQGDIFYTQEGERFFHFKHVIRDIADMVDDEKDEEGVSAVVEAFLSYWG